MTATVTPTCAGRGRPDRDGAVLRRRDRDRQRRPHRRYGDPDLRRSPRGAPGRSRRSTPAMPPSPAPRPRRPVVTRSSPQPCRATKARRNGWYATPVTVTFTCKETSAPLTTACPAPVTLSRNAAGQSVTRTIMATDGGAATAVVSGINIDTVRPSGPGDRGPRRSDVLRQRAGRRLPRDRPPLGGRHLQGDAHDATETGSSTSRPRPTGPATAAAPAWSPEPRRWRSAGRPMRHGHYVVHRGRTYTVLVEAATRPSYVYALGHPAAQPAAASRSSASARTRGRWA